MIVPYEEKYKEEWDDFVLNRSMNGNFLQTMNFYSYHHKHKFKDASILITKNDKIVAVIPANEMDGGNTFMSHQGSTFGGVIVGRDFADSNHYEWIFNEMISFFKEKGYRKCELKMHNWLYSPDEKHNELCDYYFQLYGFRAVSEVGFYMDLSTKEGDFTRQFESLKRRKLKKAEKNGLRFNKLKNDQEVGDFYDVLADNMKKFSTTPIHTLEELLDFKNIRLKNETSFYGVFFEDKMIAGSMVWNFCNKKVFHTQYLASRHDYLQFCPNEFLYTSLIRAAIDEGFRYLSYGTACLGHEKKYNKSLGMYKEGFNTDSYVNRCYVWERD